jgi:hypothetical protein
MDPEKVEGFQIEPSVVYSHEVIVKLLVKGADKVVTVPGTYKTVDGVIVRVPAVGGGCGVALAVVPADILERASIAHTL